MNILDELERLSKESTQGIWDPDYGVSLRTAWSISQWKEDKCINYVEIGEFCD